MQAPTILIEFLLQILQKKAEEKAMNWLLQKAEKIQSTGNSTQFFLAFSQASRQFTKNKLELNAEEIQAADDLVSGFSPDQWNELQTARTVLMLHFPQEKESWFHAINQLFETADMHEHQALFAALPLMPFQEELLPRAIDGCRTNVALIFDAIALDNPYAPKYFPEANWNQLVLKAIFMQRPLYRIQKLDERRNMALANIARDFAHERWSAGRMVMPELWRLVVPYLNEYFLEDLERVLHSNDMLQIQAAVLALYESDNERAKEILLNYPEIIADIEQGKLSWRSIGEEFQETRL
ncbi:EboA domain-containing protein [Algoriphagus sp. CAU 1675]|uniref:EboA domain-containing protein n=1 Tax=Algoriphagus sp. CAU 1675 TaxID=3032597 RepID=UPI0023DA9B4C|nr:EboA domain-containing protein [Algoriphagus sp. CAU 1675]MDF2156724.1 EboA domain-containing protein [Algoriphagus sp. CAU 1675]